MVPSSRTTAGTVDKNTPVATLSGPDAGDGIVLRNIVCAFQGTAATGPTYVELRRAGTEPGHGVVVTADEFAGLVLPVSQDFRDLLTGLHKSCRPARVRWSARRHYDRDDRERG